MNILRVQLIKKKEIKNIEKINLLSKNGNDEEVAFVNAQEMGDWNSKEHDKGYIKYDRRFKKKRLT